MAKTDDENMCQKKHTASDLFESELENMDGLQ